MIEESTHMTLSNGSRELENKELFAHPYNYWPRGVIYWVTITVYCCCSVAKSYLCFVALWTIACRAPLSYTVSWSLLKFMSVKSVMQSKHLILCRPLLLLPPILPSIRAFSNESALHIRWPKYWSFSLSTSSSNAYPRLISFRFDWFNPLAVQGTLKESAQASQFKSINSPASTFFMVQHSQLYITTGKTIALTMNICWQSGVSAF